MLRLDSDLKNAPQVKDYVDNLHIKSKFYRMSGLQLTSIYTTDMQMAFLQYEEKVEIGQVSAEQLNTDDKRSSSGCEW